ncbi:hypothetical protein DV736_g1711, partial [Chaetothyriales sp. CBS 134916]
MSEGPEPSNWKDNSSPWLEELVVKHKSKIQTWAFRYDLTVNDCPCMEQVWQSGHDLVESLKEFRTNAGSQTPLILIAHSIGGLILKKALQVLYYHLLSYRDISNVISGICFISVPQLPPNYDEDDNILGAMIRAITKEARTRHALSGNENREIGTLCHEFKKSYYPVPILTICESVDTKVSVITKIRRGRPIIYKDISAIGSEREHGPIEVPKSHDETCNLSSTEEEFLRISKWLDQILGEAPSNIARYFKMSVPTGLDGTGTIGSHSKQGLSSAPRDKFEAVFWIKADEKDSLPLEYAGIAAALGLVDSFDDQDLQTAVHTFRSWLSHPVRRYSVSNASNTHELVRWLLVFDNVENVDTLIDFLPMSGPGSVLMTTRDSLIKLKIPTVPFDLNLTPLSEKESVDLIQLLTKRSATQEQQAVLSEIATILGGLPLLITSMAGAMRRLKVTYVDFLDLYKNSGLKHTSSYDNTYGNTYDIFAKFGFEKLASSALGMLQVFAFLNPDRIQEEILNSDGRDDIHDTDFPSSSTQYFTARKLLLQSSLIYLSQNTDEGDSYIRLHRMVQHITRQKLGKDGEVKYLNAAISLVSKIWPFRPLEKRFDRSRYDENAKYFNHVLSLRNAYEQLSESAPDLLLPNIAAARLFNDAGWYWFEQGYPQEAKPFFKLTQSICEASEERPTEEVLYIIREAHNNQGSAAAETNDKEGCLQHNKEWLKMTLLRQGGGIIDYELGIVHNEIGVAYAMNEQYDEAVLNFLASINCSRSLSDGKLDDWPMPNLGFIYWVQGKYEEAEAVLTEVLGIRATMFGENDTQSFTTGKILYALGNVYTSMGKFDDGYKYHQNCLKQYQVTLRPDNHRVADTYHRLADHCFRLHDYDQARHYISRALDIFGSRSYYKNEYARSTYKEAEILHAMGLSDLANESFLKAFQSRQTVYPDDDRDMADLCGEDYDKMVIFWSR